MINLGQSLFIHNNGGLTVVENWFSENNKTICLNAEGTRMACKKQRKCGGENCDN